jgi:hypothetical protein
MWKAKNLIALTAIALALPALAATPLLERLEETSLNALRKDGRRLRQGANPTGQSGEFLDVRCVFHAHSRLSHDSIGTEAQIVAGAKAARVRAVFMTEHPTPDRKWSTEGLRGEKDGVLFVSGAELSDGLLVWRSEGKEWTPDMPARPALESLKGSNAVAFVAHPEQRVEDKDWDLPPFAGMEIYNSHADAVDNDFEKVLSTVRNENPVRMLSRVNTLKKYPREAFASIFDEQTEVLKRWDRLNAGFLGSKRRVVGIAGNDSHQNVGFSIEAGQDTLIIKDALGKVIKETPQKNVPLLLLGPVSPGGSVLAHTFDPYDVSFNYVSTHVLAKGSSGQEVTEDALFDAVLKGRAYVAFDWMADPSGFRYFGTAKNQAVEMGSDVRTKDRPTLTVRPNMSCQIRLLRNGQEVQRVEGAELAFQAREPGVYRAEAWVEIAGQMRPWVYTNPIYVTAN